MAGGCKSTGYYAINDGMLASVTDTETEVENQVAVPGVKHLRNNLHQPAILHSMCYHTKSLVKILYVLP